MPAGFLQTSILCVLKVPNSGTSTAPCVTVGIDRYVPVKQTTYVLYPATESAIDAISAKVDRGHQCGQIDRHSERRTRSKNQRQRS